MIHAYSAGYIHRLGRLKPRASKSRTPPIKVIRIIVVENDGVRHVYFMIVQLI
jgi:hypothetical protein